MQLFAIGINHKTTPIEMRERFAITESSYDDLNQELLANPVIHEHVTLSTCNRTEIYGVTSDMNSAQEHVLDLLGKLSNLDTAIYQDHLYIHADQNAVHHLFCVASGLDSMALGETEILGQVKDAYLKAHANGYSQKVLNTLFQKSLKVGKQARTDTPIGAGRVSIASIAVELAKKIFFKLKEKKILLIGSGVVARQVCEVLVSQGVNNVVIANRNEERAEALVSDFGGFAVSFDDLDTWAPQCDIVISSAGCPKAFISEERVSGWMRHKDRQGLFLIDLGVPRNIMNQVNEIPDVYLYDIDDLNSIANQNMQGRHRAAEQCKVIMLQAMQGFVEWFNKEHAANRIDYAPLEASSEREIHDLSE